MRWGACRWAQSPEPARRRARDGFGHAHSTAAPNLPGYMTPSLVETSQGWICGGASAMDSLIESCPATFGDFTGGPAESSAARLALASNGLRAPI